MTLPLVNRGSPLHSFSDDVYLSWPPGARAANSHATAIPCGLYYLPLMVLDSRNIAFRKGIAMGSGLAQLDRITADIQANDLEWVEVAEGSYFKALTIHVPTNTVAYAFRMDPGAPTVICLPPE